MSYRRFSELLTDIATVPRQWTRGLGQPTRPRSRPEHNAEDDGWFWALKDVTLDVHRGEVLGVIGRNGAGKSTLLKILSRITEPTTGEADIYGRVGSLLEVGAGFHPELTGRENIFLYGAVLGMTRAEISRKFDEIVSFAEVEQFLDLSVKRYSSGMYTRLAFSVAAHLESEILIVDEVLAVGDAEFQKKCLGKMGSVASQGRTVLFVSHNMHAVEALCDGIILMSDGRLSNASSDVRGTISSYLFGNAHGTATPPCEWINVGNAYGNGCFVPRRFRLCTTDGVTLSMPMRCDAEAYIEIDADVLAIDPALTVGYAIYSESGDTLYWSYHTDTTMRDWPTLQIGRQLLRSLFPRRLLNEGVYRVELIGGLSHRQWFFEPQKSAPSVCVTIQGGLSDSPLWMNRRPGVLAPVIPWAIVPPA
jgi:lipopolysaccharide transport system ATP-binding protein